MKELEKSLSFSKKHTRAVLACLRSEETSTVAGPQRCGEREQGIKSFIRDGPGPDHERISGAIMADGRALEGQNLMHILS